MTIDASLKISGKCFQIGIITRVPRLKQRRESTQWKSTYARILEKRNLLIFVGENLVKPSLLQGLLHLRDRSWGIIMSLGCFNSIGNQSHLIPLPCLFSVIRKRPYDF